MKEKFKKQFQLRNKYLRYLWENVLSPVIFLPILLGIFFLFAYFISRFGWGWPWVNIIRWLF